MIQTRGSHELEFVIAMDGGADDDFTAFADEIRDLAALMGKVMD